MSSYLTISCDVCGKDLDVGQHYYRLVVRKRSDTQGSFSDYRDIHVQHAAEVLNKAADDMIAGTVDTVELSFSEYRSGRAKV